MSGVQVPGALAERLGTEGARALSGMIESAHAEWTEDMLMLAEERFARGLTMEVSKLRVDFARDLSDLRQDLCRHVADVRQDAGTAVADLRQDVGTAVVGVRQDIGTAVTGVRQDLASAFAGVRQELATAAAGVRQDLATAKVEMFKWSFVFWIGQVAAIAGLLALMLGVGA